MTLPTFQPRTPVTSFFAIRDALALSCLCLLAAVGLTLEALGRWLRSAA